MNVFVLKKGLNMKFPLSKMICILVLGYLNAPLNASAPMLLSSESSSLSLSFGTDIYSVSKDIPLSQKEMAMVGHVKNSIEHAWVGISQILESTQRQIEGMSSTKIRHLLSNLCLFPHTRYLEIGTWKGSTFIAALCNNQATIEYAIGIDNWSEGGREDFERNCQEFLPKEHYNYEFYSENCFAINPVTTIKAPINVYFYSGDNSAISQERAFTYYNDILDDVFIVVVDRWSFESTREGVATAFNKLNYQILFEADLPANKVLWWDGLYIAVIRNL